MKAKAKLVLLSVSLITYLAGLLFTIGGGIKVGAILVITASAIILALYFFQIIQSLRQNKIWKIDNLLYTLAVLVFAVIFVHGFSVSIDMPLLGNIPGFRLAFLVSGIFLIILFLAGSIKRTSDLGKWKKRQLLITKFTLMKVKDMDTMMMKLFVKVSADFWVINSDRLKIKKNLALCMNHGCSKPASFTKPRFIQSSVAQ